MFVLNSNHHQIPGDADSAEDVMPLRAMMVPQAHRRSRTHRVRRMAQSLKSPFVPQPHTRQSAIPMDLKEAIAFVFNTDMDPRYCTLPMSYCCILHVIQEGHYSFPIISEELVSLYGTHLTRGNLGCFEGSHWIGNEVNLISNLLYPISFHIFTIYWSIIYMGVYL